METTTPKTAIRITYYKTYYALLEDGRLLRHHPDAWAEATAEEENNLRVCLCPALCGGAAFPADRCLHPEGWQHYEIFDHQGEKPRMRGELKRLDFAPWLQAACEVWQTANPWFGGRVRAVVVDSTQPNGARCA